MPIRCLVMLALGTLLYSLFSFHADRCAFWCNTNYHPVCGELPNGGFQSYPNLCELQLAICKGDAMSNASDSKCGIFRGTYTRSLPGFPPQFNIISSNQRYSNHSNRYWLHWFYLRLYQKKKIIVRICTFGERHHQISFKYAAHLPRYCNLSVHKKKE